MTTTTFVEYNGDGSDLTFDYSFPTYKQSEVKVAVSGVLVDNWTITGGWTASGTKEVKFDNTTGTTNAAVCNSSTGAPLAGTNNVRIFRDTDIDSAKYTFNAGSSIKADELNTNHEQLRRALQEEQYNTVHTYDIKDGAINTDKILDGTIVDADVSPTAEIQVSKLKDGSARQVLQTAANGSDVEWTSNVDIPGTLDVQGNTKLEGNLDVTGSLDVNSLAHIAGATGIDGNFDINTTKFTVNATSGNTTVAGTLDVTGLSTLASVDINGGAIDNTTIGASSAVAGTFSTGTIATADINGGAIDGTVIGASSAAAGTFTTGTIATADINGGAIDGTTIGASSAAAGTFTTVTASGTITGNVTGNITGDITGDVTGDLTGNADTATALATGRTIASTGDVVWNSGSFDGTANKTAAATIQNDAVTYAKMQNVSSTNKVLGRDSGGAGIVEEISPSALRTMINVEDGADVTDATNVDAAGAVMNADLGTKGQIIVGGTSPTILPVGTNNHVLVADSNEASGVKWATTPAGSGLSNVIEDTSPQLGGDLDVNGNDIVSVSNGNINITPNGSGDVVIDGLKYPQADGSANQFLKTNGSAQLSWADVDLSAKFTKAGDSITGDSTIVSGVTNKNIHIDINNADTLIRFDDDLKATFGDADDLQVYWNGTQGHIIAPSGRVDITADSFQLVSHDTGGRAIYLDDSNGRLELGHDGYSDAYFNGGSITLLNDTTLNAQKDLRFADADSSNYVAFQAPATIGSNVTWTLPAADGSANQVLKTAGDGTLSWTTISGTITALNNQTVSTTLAATGQITGRGFECPATVTADWAIAADNNAMFPGPMTIASAKTVTVPAGRTLTIV